MDTRYNNPGKILREWFPDQTATPKLILLWTFLYLVNLALTVWFSYQFVYTIPRDDGGAWPPDFSAYLDREQLDAYGAYGGGFYVLYRAEDGTRHVVRLSGSYVFRRLHVDRSTDQPIPDGDSVPVEIKTLTGTTRFTVTNDTIETGVDTEWNLLGYLTHSGNGPELGIYMVIALIPLGLEMLIHSLLRRAFRG